MAHEDKSTADDFIAKLLRNDGSLGNADVYVLLEYLESLGRFRSGRHAHSYSNTRSLGNIVRDQTGAQSRLGSRPGSVRSAATAPSQWEDSLNDRE
jgi:hypothetical protein